MRKSTLLWFGLAITVLVALGLIVLSSASEVNALKYHKDSYWFLKRQFIYLAVGAVMATIVALIDYRVWRQYMVLDWIMYIFVFVLLLLVFPVFGGRAINGSFRWINLGPINLQPSELAKLVIVVVIAAWMDRASWRVELFGRGIFMPMLIIAGLAVPILFETDLGSTMVLGMAGLLVMFVAGVRLVPFMLMMLLGGGIFIGKLAVTGNRVRRLAVWMPPWLLDLCGIAAPTTSGLTGKPSEMDSAMYQSYNALVAFRNGGIMGVGMGESMQKQYYLPEAHTDFIFAIGAEELGLGFSMATFVLFLIFFSFCIAIAHNAADRFGKLLVIGMSFILFFPAIFNMGVVCGAMPTKGIALPFFSYGGTNMVSAFLALGIIFSVGLHSCIDGKHTVKR